jgi:hypothetical protein
LFIWPEYNIRRERNSRPNSRASIKILNQMYAPATESTYYFIPSKSEIPGTGRRR